MRDLERLLRSLDEAGIPAGAHLLLALSGGADSSAMALMLSSCGAFRLSAAHVNHHLREADSDADEQFVRKLCDTLAIPLTVLDGALSDGSIRDRGLEGAARIRRYQLLDGQRQRAGAFVTATAHQRDDQAETILMRVISGSRIASLQGIAQRTATLVRPLLEYSREELSAIAEAAGVHPRHDQSNDDRRHVRNRIRHDVLPLLREINPSIAHTLSELGRQARVETAIISERIAAASERFVVRRPASSEFLPGAEGWLLESLLLHEVRRLEPQGRELSSGDLRRIACSFPQITALSVTAGLELRRNGNRMILQRRTAALEDWSISLPSYDFIGSTPAGSTISIQRVIEGEPVRGLRFVAPATGEWVVRLRRTGDRFRPAPRRSERSVASFLSDRKVPAAQRRAVPLLVIDGEIACVGDLTVSERFRPRTGSEDMHEVLVEYP